MEISWYKLCILVVLTSISTAAAMLVVVIYVYRGGAFTGRSVDYEYEEATSPVKMEQKKKQEDPRIVDILYATNRERNYVEKRDVTYTGQRADNLSFGVAQVRVPDNHSEGNVERPWTFTFVTLNLYTAKEDPRNHFIVRAVKEVDDQQFVDIVKSYGEDTAILFVHGYNNSFEDGVFRLAQIVFDGQLFNVVPVLFSWPSRNNVLAYRYDEDSADLSAEYFLDVLNLLQTKAHIKTVHIIAHSMGNRIVLNALDRAANWLKPRPLGELVFAAADIDRKRFTQLAETVQQVAHGMTLYASADDEALWWSGEISSEMPRAGTVTNDGPVIVKGVESIDMTAANKSSPMQDLFDPLGLNTHNSFMSPVILDIARLLSKGEHPPNSRTSSIHSVPERAPSPRYWRYVN